MKDYLLLRMALDGLDFQEARRELTQADPGPASSPVQDAPEPRPSLPVSHGVDVLEISTLQAHVLEMEVQGDGVSVQVQSVHVQSTRVTLQRTQAPQPAGQDPLVIDLSGEGPATTGEDGARLFDLQGTGQARPTSFPKGDTALLVLDRDHNGAIDDGRELFGDQHGALDGFEELRSFDVNADDRIDAQDAVFGQLELMWGDGSRQALGTYGIASISLAATAGRSTTTTGGDPVLRQGTAMTVDGKPLDTYALALRQFDLLA